jgi:predicted Zn-dependent protease
MNDGVTATCQCASGYLELGMPEEALTELAGAEEGSSHVMHLRVEALFQLQRWGEAAVICLPMLQRESGQPSWWIQTAYALRRSRSLAEAEVVLQAGFQHHPDDLLVAYNLACYACVQGREDEARGLLERAMRASRAEVLKMAAKDPDLLGIRPWVLDQAAG